MSNLKTNFKDDIFSGFRKYIQTKNDDGTISLTDATMYTQEGDRFGATEINGINNAVNELNGGMTELKKSVSDGKKLVAEAITGKGQATEADATFAVMAENIKNIETSKVNVYVQTNEPDTKEGIWINAEGGYNGIVTDNQPYLANAWAVDGTFKAIPFSFYDGSAVAINTDVFLFGGAGGDTTAYKYDTLTNVYTKLANIPYSFLRGSAAVVGTNVFLFGGSSSSWDAYKYDTLTNVYTRLAGITGYNFYDGSAVAVGTNVFLFGGNPTADRTKAYKYDTLTNANTNIRSVPSDFYNGCAATIGTDIFLFGGHGGNTTAYKYDTLVNTYTKLSNIPVAFVNGSAVAVGTDVYLFGYTGTTTKTAYKYDTLTNVYTNITDIPFSFYKSDAVFADSKAFLLGGTEGTTRVQAFAFTSKQYAEDTVVIFRNNESTGTYLTQIFNDASITGTFSRFTTSFNNAWIFKNGDLQQLYPTCYGNGDSWVKFKN